MKPLHSSMSNSSLPLAGIGMTNLKHNKAPAVAVETDQASLKDGLQKLASSLEGTGQV